MSGSRWLPATTTPAIGAGSNLPPDLRKVDVDLPDNAVAIGLTARRTGGSGDILEALLHRHCGQHAHPER